MAGGRPTTYNPQIAKEICDAISSSSKGLEPICAAHKHFPAPSTVHKWRIEHKEFSEKYDQAKKNQIEVLVDECLDIADDTSHDTLVKTNKDGEEYEVANTEWINRSKLRIDTRKWLAAKLAPRIYGDTKKDDEGNSSQDFLNQLLKLAKESKND